MYRVYCNPDGTFDCVARSRGDTDRWTAKTLDEVVEGMKRFAKNVNHDPNLEKKDITFLEPFRLETTEWRRCER